MNRVSGGSRITPQTHFKRLGRELAMQYLYQRDMTSSETSAEESSARERFWEQADEAGIAGDEKIFRKARTYADDLIQGVLFNLEELDRIIASFSEKWDIRRMAAVDRNIIRVAIYELKYRPDIPALVSIDEAIEISKEFATEKSGVFINGILNGVKNTLPPDAKEGRKGSSAE